jgi:hypothetical protein
MRRISFKEKETVLREGSHSRDLFIVETGSLIVTRFDSQVMIPFHDLLSTFFDDGSLFVINTRSLSSQGLAKVQEIGRAAYFGERSALFEESAHITVDTTHTLSRSLSPQIIALQFLWLFDSKAGLFSLPGRCKDTRHRFCCVALCRASASRLPGVRIPSFLLVAFPSFSSLILFRK